MVLSGTSSAVDKSTKTLGGVVEKGMSLDLLAGAPPSTSDTSEFVGQQTSMPETFADLLRIHGVDATLWDELNHPSADCVSPLKTPIPATRHRDEPNLEESALVCASSLCASAERQERESWSAEWTSKLLSTKQFQVLP